MKAYFPYFPNLHVILQSKASMEMLNYRELYWAVGSARVCGGR